MNKKFQTSTGWWTKAIRSGAEVARLVTCPEWREVSRINVGSTLALQRGPEANPWGKALTIKRIA